MNYIAPKEGDSKLTPEEIAQFRLIARSKAFLTAEHERFLHYLWKVHQYLPARNLLVIKHLPFIGKMVRNFKGAPLNDAPPIDAALEKWERPLGIRYEMLAEAVCGPDTKTDLMREVWNPRGFLRAIDTFDPEMGCRLATHAAYSVLDALRQWNVRHRRRGEVGAEKGAKFRKHHLLSEVIGTDEAGNELTLADIIADDHDYSAAEREADDAIRAELIDKTLDERERIIWESRHPGRRKPWLCEDERPVTFEVLGKQLGMSSQAVQQRAAVAEKKLRKAAATKPERGPVPKPDVYVYRRPYRPAHSLFSSRKYPCRVYSPEEIAALVASRPDLSQPDEMRLAA
jgi:RNA polymerase sigma factor (sigma-70 family)